MKKKVIIPSLLIIMICIVLAVSLFIQQQQNKEVLETFPPMKLHALRQQSDMGRGLTEKITIGAIGDVLIHDVVYQDAFNGKQFNFDPNFENVKSLLQKPDILTANQE